MSVSTRTGKGLQPRIATKIPRIVHAGEHGLFFGLLRREGLPEPMTEYVFAAPRKWRFDFAWVTELHREPGNCYNIGIALEVEGGVWTRGRHTRGKGFLADCAKYNEAACRGWRLIRVTPSQLCTLDTIALIRRALTLHS